MQITGIILAGGKSKRMGTDKALLEVEGISLLEGMINKLKPLCSEIIISSNHKSHAKYGFPVYEDEVSDCGPIGGLYTCLAKSKTDWNLVVSVDSAYIEPEFLRFLVDNAADSDAVIPLWERGKEPLIALYKRSCITVLNQMINDRNYKMHNLFQLLKIKYVGADEWVKKYPKLFYNLNRPEDL